MILLSLLAFLIGFIVGVSTKSFNIEFAILLGFPFPIAAVCIGKLINNLIFAIGKERTKKGKIMASAIFLYLFKYLIVVLPIITGMAIDLGLHSMVFDPIGLVIIVLVYALTTIIVQFYFIQYKKNLKKGVAQ